MMPDFPNGNRLAPRTPNRLPARGYTNGTFPPHLSAPQAIKAVSRPRTTPGLRINADSNGVWGPRPQDFPFPSPSPSLPFPSRPFPLPPLPFPLFLPPPLTIPPNPRYHPAA